MSKSVVSKETMDKLENDPQFKPTDQEVKEAPKEESPDVEPEVIYRKVKVLLVNPVDFMYLFVKGMKFRKQTKIMEGLPEDAELVGCAYDAIRGAIMMVVKSEEYEPIPTTDSPPAQFMKIQIGDRKATKKKPVARKKKGK